MRHFDSLCTSIENLHYSESGERLGEEPMQYTKLCEWLLDVSAGLMASIDAGTDYEGSSEVTGAGSGLIEESSRRFKYLEEKICKARIWSSRDHRLFHELQEAAKRHMLHISSLCEESCKTLLDGPDGERLRSLQLSDEELSKYCRREADAPILRTATLQLHDNSQRSRLFPCL